MTVEETYYPRKNMTIQIPQNCSTHIIIPMVPFGKLQLASYHGKAITYDNIGNRLTYNGWTFTIRTTKTVIYKLFFKSQNITFFTHYLDYY